jgi:hypothetical protein
MVNTGYRTCTLHIADIKAISIQYAIITTCFSNIYLNVVIPNTDKSKHTWITAGSHSVAAEGPEAPA